MALRNKSLFLYGFEVTTLNQSLDFRAAALGPVLQATLRLGFYSLTSLLDEVIRAMTEVDTGGNVYTYSIDRTYNSGTENRVTILTNGAFLSLLFLTGPRTASTCAPLLGYTTTDKTGATSYQSQASAGVVLIPELVGYTYLGPELQRKIQGSVNISASGEKEAVVFAVQQFIEVEFKYEPEAKALTEWADFLTWTSKQRLFEFTPDYTLAPATSYEATMESTSGDGKGLGYVLAEMLPEFPFFYRTGRLKMRRRVSTQFL
jgi:hypothetical protein